MFLCKYNEAFGKTRVMDVSFEAQFELQKKFLLSQSQQP